MPDTLDRLTAALVDRYTLQRELGRGGMATVYLAEDLKHHRPVALKVLKPELAPALGPDRFLREIAVTAQLEHPHIVPLYDSGEAAGFLFYVMPYVEGESLRARLQREPQLPLDEALHIAREVADALGHAHARGIVHRDVKPENVLLEGGHARVADFGIAKALTEAGGNHLTATGMAIGTPAYMSPEQASGAEHLDGRSDLYSLGCVLYEMLTGDPPFHASTPQALLARKLSEPLPRVSVVRESVPLAIERAVTRALARVPADRFATAREFCAALSVGPDRSHKRRRLTGWGAVAASALAIGILAGGIGASRIPAGTRAIVLTLLRRPAAELKAERVLIAAFEDETGDTAFRALGALAADWIGQGLAQVPGTEVVDAGTTFGMQELVSRIPWPLRARDKGIAMAEEVGAGTLVTGTVYLEGDSLLFVATITDVGRERLVRTLAPVRGSRTAPSRALSELRNRVAASLALSLDATGGTSITTLAEPPSLEAYRELAAGYEAYLRREDSAEFLHLERAIQLDSSYTTPLVFLALVRAYRFQYAVADTILRLAERLIDRMTPAERVLVDHLRAFIRGDAEEALRAGERFVRLIPGSDQSPFLLASTALSVMRPRLAQSALARTNPDRGLNLASPMYWTYQAMAAAELGDWSRSLTAARSGLRRFPESLALHRFEVRALARLHRVREMEQAISRVPAATQPVTAQADLAVKAWADLRATEQTDAAAALITRYNALLETAGEDTVRDARFVRGSVLWRAGYPAEARDIFAALAGTDTGIVRLHDVAQLGIANALLGDHQAAAQAEREIAAADVPWGRGTPQLLQATIAAALGERDRAVQLLRQGLALGLGLDALGGGLFGNPDLEPLFGYEPFEALIRPIG